MAKFITIGERISVTAPAIRRAVEERDPEPIITRCEQQLSAGANYIDVNIGPAESDGEERMTWAVKLLQERFDNVPLALDTAVRSGRVERGQLLLLEAFGGGFTWGSALLRY